MNLLDNCSVVTGIALSDEACLVTLMNDELAAERRQHSIPVLFDGDVWSFVQDEPVLPWITAAVVMIGGSSGASLIVGWGGQVLVLRDGVISREAILRRDSRPVSIIRCVCSIDDAVYAAGMSRQVYQRTDGHGWRAIDNGVVDGGEDPVGFNAIGGFDRSEIYAAGMNGEVWLYDGQSWRKLDAPTSAHLHSLCCAADGYVYIGGRNGILVRGRKEVWDTLDVESDETIWDLEWFGDKLYLILGNSIRRYVGGGVTEAENRIPVGDFEMFSSFSGKMWVFGRKKIVRFDGAKWSELSSDAQRSNVDARLLGFFNNDVLEQGSEYLED